jgi:CBS domain-containing protein
MGVGNLDIRELKVRDVMHTDWPTLDPEGTVEDVIGLFAERNISGAPVVDESGRLIGIVTEGDLILRDAEIKAPGFLDILGGMIPLGSWEEYREEVRKSAGVGVRTVMTEDPVTIEQDASLSEAATRMSEKGVRVLPVVEGDRLVGVINRMDILTLHILRPRT